MSLDFPTILITSFMTSFLVLSIMIVLYAQFKGKYEGIGYLLLSVCVQLLGILLISLRNVLPVFVSILVSNLLIALGFVFAFCGFIRFFGHVHKRMNHMVTLGVFVGIYCYFSLIQESLKVRIILMSALFLYYSYWYVHYFIVQKNHHLKRLQAIQLPVVGLYVVASILRVFVALFIADSVDDYFDYHPFGLYLDFATIMLGSIMPILWMVILNKRLQNEVTMQENRFERFFMSSPSAMVITDLKTNMIKDVNESFTILSGFGHEDVIGRTSTELDLWFDPEERIRIVDEVKKTGYVRVTDQRFRNRFGEDVYAMVTFVVIEHMDETFLLTTVNDITDLHHVQRELEFIAMHDYLTLLPNRTKLYQHIDLLIEKQGDAYTVVMCDLNCFKEINDRFGHDVGDLVLTEVARKLHGAIDQQTFLCRYGGDEFLFILRTHDHDHLLSRIEHFRTALETPFVIDDHEFLVTGAFGYADYPKEGSDFHEIVKVADMRVYEQKGEREACDRIARRLKLK